MAATDTSKYTNLAVPEPKKEKTTRAGERSTHSNNQKTSKKLANTCENLKKYSTR